MTEKHDIEGVFVKSIVAQIQNLNLTTITDQQVKSAISEALIQNLSQIINHPDMVSHIRKLANDVLEDRLRSQGKTHISKEDSQQIAEKIWSGAEKEVAQTLSGLMQSSQKTVERVFQEYRWPEWKEYIVNIPPSHYGIVDVNLQSGDVLEFWTRVHENFTWFNIEEPSGNKAFGCDLPLADVYFRPIRFEAPLRGTYRFMFLGDTYENKKGTFEYRFLKYGKE